MSNPARRQRGVTLLISLIMLTMLTVFAAAMIRLSSSNMLIAGNMAVQHALRDTLQQAIETDLNSAGFFNDVVNSTGPWAGGATTYAENKASYNNYSITLHIPVCLKAQPAAGYSALSSATGLEDTYWEVQADGSDPATGASLSLVQGIKITLPVGNCNGT